MTIHLMLEDRIPATNDENEKQPAASKCYVSNKPNKLFLPQTLFSLSRFCRCIKNVGLKATSFEMSTLYHIRKGTKKNPLHQIVVFHCHRMLFSARKTYSRKQVFSTISLLIRIEAKPAIHVLKMAPNAIRKVIG